MVYLRQIKIVIAALALLVALPTYAEAKQRIITGCDPGAREKHVQDYPRETLGAVPNRILNWEISLARGVYTIRIASWNNFVPLIYIKNRAGKYVGAGINTSTARKISPRTGRPYYEKVFTANHNNDVWNNFWLLQIKPVQQNINQKVEVAIVHKSCPKQKQTRCHCPPGSYENKNMTWGQSECIDRKTGKVVPMICN